MMPPPRFFLRCTKGQRPDIEVSPGEPLVLGRGPLTRIKNSKISRRHLKLRLRENSSAVIIVEHIGRNSRSVVGGQALWKGQIANLKVDETLEFLEDSDYKYVLMMAKEEEEEEEEEDQGTSKKDKRSHWSSGLLESMNDPEMKLFEDERIVIIKDKYPKARHHFLVLPKSNIANLRALRKEHVPLVRHMLEKAREFCSSSSLKNVEFRFGYHAVPSMARVHLHAISTDMDSPCLKTKKHWNSFTTEYFLDPDSILEELERKGKVEPAEDKAKELLKQDLKCNHCDYKAKNLPDLKKHILRHL